MGKPMTRKNASEPAPKRRLVVELAKEGHETAKRICQPMLRTLFVPLPRGWEKEKVAISVSVERERHSRGVGTTRPSGSSIHRSLSRGVRRKTEQLEESSLLKFSYQPGMIRGTCPGNEHFDSIVVIPTDKVDLKDRDHSEISDLILGEVRDSPFVPRLPDDHWPMFSGFIKDWFRLKCAAPHRVLASDLAVVVSSVALHNLGLSHDRLRPDVAMLDRAYDSLVRSEASRQPNSDHDAEGSFSGRSAGKIAERDFAEALHAAKTSYHMKYLFPFAELTAERLGSKAPLDELTKFKASFEASGAAGSTSNRHGQKTAFTVTRLAAEYRGEGKLQSYMRRQLNRIALSLTDLHRVNCKACGKSFRKYEITKEGEVFVIRYGPNLAKSGPVKIWGEEGVTKKPVIMECPECHKRPKPRPPVPGTDGPTDPPEDEGYEPDTRAAWDFVDSLIEHISDLLAKQRAHGATRSPPDKRSLDKLIADSDRLFRSGLPKILQHLQDVQSALPSKKQSKSADNVEFLADLAKQEVRLGPLPGDKCPVPISVRLGQVCLAFIETRGEAELRDAIVVLRKAVQLDRSQPRARRRRG